MKNEGQCAFKKLRERRSMILLKTMELSEIYEKLMVLSKKPFLELLQVSMEECRSLFCLRPILVIVILR